MVPLAVDGIAVKDQTLDRLPQNAYMCRCIPWLSSYM